MRSPGAKFRIPLLRSGRYEHYIIVKKGVGWSIGLSVLVIVAGILAIASSAWVIGKLEGISVLFSGTPADSVAGARNVTSKFA